MQLVDLLFLVVIVLSASSGWRAGFVVTATGLITWVGSSGLGVLPGLINGIVAAAVIALLFMALPLSDRLT